MRHFDLLLVRRGSDSRWCHAGSWALRCGFIFIVAKLTLYFCAAFRILIVSSSILAALPPLCGGFHVCRKQFMRVRVSVPWGMDASIIRSIMFAHIGREGEKSRYALSHVISIVSFLALMLIRLRPPFSMGLCRFSRAILDMVPPSQTKLLVIFVRVFSISLGIPCAFARNWVWPPMMAWAISFLPLSVGLDFPHSLRFLFMLSNMGSHGDFRLVLFLIHAPRDRTASPSFAILMRSSSGIWSCGLSLRVRFILLWCSSEPSGMISVFSILNLAPDAWHHSFRRVWTWSIRSWSFRYTFVSSANIVTIIFSSTLGIFRPSKL